MPQCDKSHKLKHGKNSRGGMASLPLSASGQARPGQSGAQSLPVPTTDSERGLTVIVPLHIEAPSRGQRELIVQVAGQSEVLILNKFRS